MTTNLRFWPLVLGLASLSACGGTPVSPAPDATPQDIAPDVQDEPDVPTPPVDVQPDRTLPPPMDAPRPDTSVPDTSVPDTSVPDTSVPDTSVPDVSVTDVAPDLRVSDVAPPSDIGPTIDMSVADAVTDVAVDTGLVCPSGQSVCGGACRDLGTDRAHCGACDHGCLSGEICTTGMCALSCPSGQSPCAGTCRFLQTDVAHCGMCGRACSVPNAVPACVDGACAVASCNAGFGDCDTLSANGCETDTRTSTAHCGRCANTCRAGELCVEGACRYTVARSCREVQTRDPRALDGAYSIDPDGAGGAEPFMAWCDLATDGGGWTLIGRVGEAAPSASRGDLRSDRNSASLTSNSVPTSTEFSTLDLARFNPYANQWSVRIIVDSSNNLTHFQYSYYRPREGAAITAGVAGLNWLDTSTPAAMEYLTRSSNIGQDNSMYLPVQGFDRTSATVVVFAYRRGSDSSACLNTAGENQLCHAPAGGITNESALTGTYTAAFSNSDGVSHSWGRRATLWLRDSLCPPNTLDCDGVATNGCEARVRDDAANCGACARACATGQICSLGACRAPYPRNCLELHRSDPTATNGSVVIDPDGPGAMRPFAVYCDMALDGGGWTLLGAGAWWMNTADLVAAPGGANTLLSDARRNAIIATSANLYRNGSTAIARQFIEDTGADFGPATPMGGRHYWRSRARSLLCATTYSAVTGGTMALTTSRDMDCDPTGVGSHTCGVTSGWILFHDLDTYNISGSHPCAFGRSATPTGRALGDLWVR